MKKNETLYVLDVGSFGSQAEMPEARSNFHLIEKFGCRHNYSNIRAPFNPHSPDRGFVQLNSFQSPLLHTPTLLDLSTLTLGLTSERILFLKCFVV
jgi:hypothetical protein